MKVAVIYNRESQSVINLFGLPNREKYGKKSIRRIVNGLKKYGHQVKAFEGDKDLIENLEKFMPRVLKGERPGMAFNLSYGIQGQARYTHVPGILEMIGIPYVGSGPLAHSLALDKVVAKMIFVQNNLPTPSFAVINPPELKYPGLPYPLIVKPRNEAVSMGIRVVYNQEELMDAVQAIFDLFQQGALVEQYIEGREINVGIIGNNPPEALSPCEIVIRGEGPNIYTIEDKKGNSGREIDWICPAPIGEELTQKAREIAIGAFTALGCNDCARVDMRLDRDGNLHILEINSLPSLGEHGSYTIAAKNAGLDFPALINRLAEEASARYFGTPTPPEIRQGENNAEQKVFQYITQRRDLIEKQIKEWCALSSRTSDPVGNAMVIKKLDSALQELKMRPINRLTDTRSVCAWETRAGMDGGTLIVGHLDVPFDQNIHIQSFRRDPEWLYGEGIAMSRSPLVMMLFALRALRHIRRLAKLPLGVLYYFDEGHDCCYSANLIRSAASGAKRVLVLRPGSPPSNIRTQRRGRRKYHLIVEGSPQRIGVRQKTPDAVSWCIDKLEKMISLSSRKDRLALAVVDMKTESFLSSPAHRVAVTFVISYLDPKLADLCEENVHAVLAHKGVRWSLKKISERPPMKKTKGNDQLAKTLDKVARKWDIPLTVESSVVPSAAGLIPVKVPVICGLGPVARDRYTPQEAISRISLIQRTLLLTEFLAEELENQ
ncbi:ATP-grasp domain-containing protein [Desulfonema magnum]|uniref:D-alanine--D-alanine ligase domain-containing protein n=1 Tax=Desulfonema magnum TaxID=45655 RepID=A0A975BK50_9BACT|nr:ATP-grasp domain-containing protein [Desulfonema magnum]QTA86575.1 D-alanine--D-alanine ligase domain-containing protein [Desulfonema magnum]